MGFIVCNIRTAVRIYGTSCESTWQHEETWYMLSKCGGGKWGCLLTSIQLTVIFRYLIDGRAAGYPGPLQWFCFGGFV